jgi:hypothetical protein
MSEFRPRQRAKEGYRKKIGDGVATRSVGGKSVELTGLTSLGVHGLGGITGIGNRLAERSLGG